MIKKQDKRKLYVKDCNFIEINLAVFFSILIMYLFEEMMKIKEIVIPKVFGIIPITPFIIFLVTYWAINEIIGYGNKEEREIFGKY